MVQLNYRKMSELDHKRILEHIETMRNYSYLRIPHKERYMSSFFRKARSVENWDLKSSVLAAKVFWAEAVLNIKFNDYYAEAEKAWHRHYQLEIPEPTKSWIKKD